VAGLPLTNESSPAGLRKTTLAIIVGACVLFYFCGPATTWSTEARSPDGLWLATAQSQQWSGPGNAYDATTVYLKRTKGRDSAIQILGFSHQYATMNLKIEWVTPTNLKVTYGESGKPGDHVDVDFQAIKCAGIAISAQHF